MVFVCLLYIYKIEFIIRTEFLFNRNIIINNSVRPILFFKIIFFLFLKLKTHMIDKLLLLDPIKKFYVANSLKI